MWNTCISVYTSISVGQCVSQVTPEQTYNCLLEIRPPGIVCVRLPSILSHTLLPEPCLSTEKQSASQSCTLQRVFLCVRSRAEKEKRASGNHRQWQVLLYRLHHLDFTDYLCESRQRRVEGKMQRFTALTSFYCCYLGAVGYTVFFCESTCKTLTLIVTALEI